MSRLCLYYDMLSPPSRALYTFLKMSAIPFEAQKISIIAGENRTPEFVQINPRKKLPALKDGDFNLSESVAIVRYIADKYRDQIADHWYPLDPRKRARVDEYLAFQHQGTRLHYSYLGVHELKALRKGHKDPEETEKLELNVKKITHIVQKTFLGDKQFLCGNEISVADIFAANEIITLEGFNRDPLDGFPKLSNWMERVSKLLNPYFAETLDEMFAMAGREIPQKYTAGQ